ncbi:MAG: response regulator [Halieaceae bacterium]|nr:response regulator [Halieaceae bacterium]
MNNQATEQWTGSGTILLVDDEEAIRTIATKVLASIGFEVITAADGLEALEHYSKLGDSIALVLLDMTMPRMNGEETLIELRRRNNEVKIVLCSGYIDAQLISAYDGDGITAFIQKPYMRNDLRTTLRQMLG